MHKFAFAITFALIFSVSADYWISKKLISRNVIGNEEKYYNNCTKMYLSSFVEGNLDLISANITSTATENSWRFWSKNLDRKDNLEPSDSWRVNKIPGNQYNTIFSNGYIISVGVAEINDTLQVTVTQTRIGVNTVIPPFPISFHENQNSDIQIHNALSIEDYVYVYYSYADVEKVTVYVSSFKPGDSAPQKNFIIYNTDSKDDCSVNVATGRSLPDHQMVVGVQHGINVSEILVAPMKEEATVRKLGMNDPLDCDVFATDSFYGTHCIQKLIGGNSTFYIRTGNSDALAAYATNNKIRAGIFTNGSDLVLLSMNITGEKVTYSSEIFDLDKFAVVKMLPDFMYLEDSVNSTVAFYGLRTGGVYALSYNRDNSPNRKGNLMSNIRVTDVLSAGYISTANSTSNSTTGDSDTGKGAVYLRSVLGSLIVVVAGVLVL